MLSRCVKSLVGPPLPGGRLGLRLGAVPLFRILRSLATVPAPVPAKQEKMVKVTVNDKPVEVPAYSTVLEAAHAAGCFVPTLCTHPSVGSKGMCRLCLVSIKGETKLQPACVTPVREGMQVDSRTGEVTKSVKFVLELMRSSHPYACATCDADGTCRLQDLWYRYQVSDTNIPPGLDRSYPQHHEWDSCPLELEPKEPAAEVMDEVQAHDSFNAIQLDIQKCIKCGRCVRACKEIQGIAAIGMVGRGAEEHIETFHDLWLDDTKCIQCGQCALICPTGAMREENEIFDVLDKLTNTRLIKVASVAPSVRVAIAEEFGLEPGAVKEEQLIEGLRKLGFDYVFDTNFTADLTIMEEGSELLQRLKKGGPFPMFTSCCPGWVNLVEKSYPELIPNLSTCKSPQGMMGPLVKNVFAKRIKAKPEDMVMVSIMPCTAKKQEARRPEHMKTAVSSVTGEPLPDTDYVLTTRELGRIFRLQKIHLLSLKGTRADDPLGEATGAAVLFGATGGVMEAALRTAYEVASSQPLPKLDFEAVRGLSGVKSAVVEIPQPQGGEPKRLRVAVVHGTAETRRMLEKIKAKEPGWEFDFIEVMACRGGCIGGGGQPKSEDPAILKKRMSKVYALDEMHVMRKSHENPSVQQLYKTVLEHPLSGLSHTWLHTSYRDRSGSTK